MVVKSFFGPLVKQSSPFKSSILPWLIAQPSIDTRLDSGMAAVFLLSLEEKQLNPC